MGYKILVADDCTVNRQLMTVILKKVCRIVLFLMREMVIRRCNVFMRTILI
jgi:hypothetical protein